MAIGSAIGSANGQTWTVAGLNTNYYWRGVAASADGTKLAAAASQSAGDGIYLSTNSGATWTLAPAPTGSWGPIICSADGTELVAANGGVSGIYISTNSGATWNQVNVPEEQWSSIAGSADGTKLLAAYPPDGVETADIYVSTNSGDSWFSPTNITGNSIATVCSADGSRMAALTYGGAGPSVLIVSTNFGLTWQPAAPLSSANGLGCAADGTKLYAVATNIYISMDWGATWSSGHPAPVFGFFACSANGSVMLGKGAGTSAFPIYTSSDGGSTWISNNVPPAVWTTFACSADGDTMVAAAGPGGVWIAKTRPSPRLNIISSNHNVNLSWVVPSTNMVLEQSLDLVHWTTLTNSPSLNLTNLQEQLTLHPTNRGAVFRLVSQ